MMIAKSLGHNLFFYIITSTNNDHLCSGCCNATGTRPVLGISSAMYQGHHVQPLGLCREAWSTDRESYGWAWPMAWYILDTIASFIHIHIIHVYTVKEMCQNVCDNWLYMWYASIWYIFYMVRLLEFRCTVAAQWVLASLLLCRHDFIKTDSFSFRTSVKPLHILRLSISCTSSLFSCIKILLAPRKTNKCRNAGRHDTTNIIAGKLCCKLRCFQLAMNITNENKRPLLFEFWPFGSPETQVFPSLPRYASSSALRARFPRRVRMNIRNCTQRNALWTWPWHLRIMKRLHRVILLERS